MTIVIGVGSTEEVHVERAEGEGGRGDTVPVLSTPVSGPSGP